MPGRGQVIFIRRRRSPTTTKTWPAATKLAAEVKGDIEKLLGSWEQWGWHRVTFYGDIKRPVQNLASLMGFEMIEEA